MRYEVSEVESFKHADSELLAALVDNLPGESESNKMEEFEFEWNGSGFSVIEVGKGDCVNEGKYENGGTYYQLVEYDTLVEFDTNIKSHSCEENIIAKYDVEIYAGWYRNGSYYTDWYYYYDEPSVYQIHIETIPEQIIPEHQVVKIKLLG